jgi:hypothetical protein
VRFAIDHVSCPRCAPTGWICIRCPDHHISDPVTIEVRNAYSLAHAGRGCSQHSKAAQGWQSHG